MLKEKKVTAVILVAGNSTRYGKNRNKNFERIHGKTVLGYSLKEFDQNLSIDDILVVAKKDEFSQVQEILKEENVKKKVTLIPGGETRKESVYHAIQSTDAPIVMIQDGARPGLKQRYIDVCLENMEKYKGVTIGVKSKDTVKITDDHQIVLETTKRSNTWLIQTPQCFDRVTLLKAHEKYEDGEVTDDCMLLEKEHNPVKILEGDDTNRKITTPEDFEMMKNFLS